MPFTFVHPVVTIPLRKYSLPLSALIIGSLTPDFNYFFLKEYHVGHTILGQFYFCLPIGILAFLMYHMIIKKPIIELFPESQSGRLEQIKSPDLRSLKIYPLVFLGLIIGSFSHIIWDSFTHEYGYAVTHFSLLRMEVLKTSFGSLKLFKILQHGSTLIGGAIILFLYYNYIRTSEIVENPNTLVSNKMRIILIVCMTIIASMFSLVKGFSVVFPISDFSLFRNFVGVVVKSFIPTAFILLFLYSILWNCYYKMVCCKGSF